jgi:hypothetical protein
MTQFLPFVPLNQLTNKAEIFVGGSRATFRLPDLMVLSPELATILETETRETITFDMPPRYWLWKSFRPEKEMKIEIIVTSDRNMQLEASLSIGLLIPSKAKS